MHKNINYRSALIVMALLLLQLSLAVHFQLNTYLTTNNILPLPKYYVLGFFLILNLTNKFTTIYYKGVWYSE